VPRAVLTGRSSPERRIRRHPKVQLRTPRYFRDVNPLEHQVRVAVSGATQELERWLRSLAVKSRTPPPPASASASSLVPGDLAAKTGRSTPPDPSTRRAAQPPTK
jgi:hypothetical protein